MDDAIKDAILRSLTKEEILEIFNEVKEVALDPQDKKANPMRSSQQYYLSRKIPGSNTRCSSCGQYLVNDEEHANELLGGEKE